MSNGSKKNFRSEYLKTMTQLATAAFGLAAALAWNEFIKSIIDRFIAPGSTLISQFYYVLVITLLAVLVTIYLGRLTQEAKEDEEKK